MTVSRREVLAGAVAIGGGLGLAIALRLESEDGDGSASRRPAGGREGDRQHGWNAVLHDGDTGGQIKPRHHLLVHFDYAQSGTPSRHHRRRLQAGLDALERRFGWGPSGILLTTGYTPAYLRRFGDDADLSVLQDVPDPEPIVADADPVLDTGDGVIHLASDSASRLLRAERELLDPLDFLRVRRRRSGFVGEGLPHRHQDVEGIPDDDPIEPEAPEYFGFHSDHGGNQATEDAVTIDDGRFAGGTTEHVAEFSLDLTDWYGPLSLRDRIDLMVDPGSSIDELGPRAERPGDLSSFDDDVDVRRQAREHGLVSHAAKVARARRDGDPLLLRRDFDAVIDGGAGFVFLSLQRRIQDLVTTQRLMMGTDLDEAFDAVGPQRNNGILSFIDGFLFRGNYLVPPASLRALPEP